MNNYPFSFYPSRFPIANPYFPSRKQFQTFYSPSSSSFNQQEEKKEDSKKKSSNISSYNENPIFEVLGISFFYDDLLLLSLIFFLYTEGLQDDYLFLALILLLLS